MSPNSDSGPASGPAVSLPKGGGAISGIGETFQATPFSGTANFTIPIAVSPARAGFQPALRLDYSTGLGNGVFGLGWQLNLPRVTRKTEKGLPTYTADDRFIVNGSEDLVAHRTPPATAGDGWRPVSFQRDGYTVQRFRPRTEGAFLRIERWHRQDGDVHWRTVDRANITTIYGLSSQARIFDADDASRVFEWLIEESFDAKGNHVLYSYARDPRSPGQCYPRRIYYGNSHRAVGPSRSVTKHDSPLARIDRNFLFEVIFDYGDAPAAPANPYTAERSGGDLLSLGPQRPDPFSTWRPGFEVRTALRCQRVLMVHHFTELGGPALVRSTDLSYDDAPATRLSLLTSVEAVAYRRTGSTYVAARTPPLTFGYSVWAPEKRRYQSIAARGGDTPSQFLEANVTWTDLFGNALPDVIHSTPTGIRYWTNTGAAVLDRPRTMANSPAGVMLAGAGVRTGDVEGDGLVNLITSDPLPGFFGSDEGDGFLPFRPFEAVPTIPASDPAVRFVDLTGDGLPDMLVTRGHHFLWFQCLGAKGYGPPRAVEREADLEAFPNVGFEDPGNRIRLADMNGDGLADIVFVHDGRVDYWPNKGYGRFGARVEMRGAPLIGHSFDPARLFLMDLDGSGCADAVYVQHDRVCFWMNQSGNAFGSEETVRGTPPVTSRTQLQFLDLFGTGTSTLVWSYDAELYPGENIKVLDLCGGEKPYLVTSMSNNMGATTRVSYASSTKFYLQDETNRTPWVTKLPFPVQVVERVEAIDHIARTKAITRYSYHHGYFDGREREFRGFGRVDQEDTETFTRFGEETLHPEAEFTNGRREYYLDRILTRSWFHTGAYVRQTELTSQYRREFYSRDPQALIPGSDEVEDAGRPWEAHRALRGALIRSEIYCLDGTPAEQHPYTVTQSSFRVQAVQPPIGADHGVFLRTEKENLIHHYERDPSDPRVGHQITLAVDGFGNLVDTLLVCYPRRSPIDAEQAAIRAVYDRRDFINAVDSIEFQYVGVPCQHRTYEIHGLQWSWLQPAIDPSVIAPLLDTSVAPSSFRPYEWQPPSTLSTLEKRLIGWQRTCFRRNAGAANLDIDASSTPRRQLTDRLALGTLESLGLPYESYKLALTSEWARQVYGQDSGGARRVDPATLSAAAYHEEPDLPGYWWIPSGQQMFAPDRFYVCTSMKDAFGVNRNIDYDAYDLLTELGEDALGNRTVALNDYRVLQPHTVIDANGNASMVAFDTLGYVTGTAFSGKGEGDSLSGFRADLDPAELDAYFDDPRALAGQLLGNASLRTIYDLHRFSRLGEPVVTASISRDLHAHPPTTAALRPVQKLTYFNGFLKTLQIKAPAEPGDVGGVPSTSRWITTGWTIVNNKQLPVQRFEPFFSRTHRYEPGIEAGVSDTFFYDPLGRRVGVLHPDGTYEKVLRVPWREEHWDTNDTVLLDPRTDPDLKAVADAYLSSLPAGYRTWLGRVFPSFDPSNPPTDPTVLTREERAALVAVNHAGTRTVLHLDVQGREYRMLTSDRGTVLETRTSFDVSGNRIAVIDPSAIVAARHTFDLASRTAVIVTPDAGQRMMFPDATGQPILTWGPDGHRTRTTCDPLRRPVERWVGVPGGSERLAERFVYGESVGTPEAANLREELYQVCDGTGIRTHVSYDFKGNVTRIDRALAVDYKNPLDWSQSVAMEPATFIARHDYDALNRLIRTRLQLHPSGTEYIYRAAYNDAGLLQQVHVALPGEAAERTIVAAIEYNEREQRSRIRYGNGVTTEYVFDSLTFRLTQLTTRSWDSRLLQDLTYVYDPCGHLTSVNDAAFPVVFNANQAIAAQTDYDYDAYYRLISATGREHESMDACDTRRAATKHTEFIPLNRPSANDGRAFRRYVENYSYDPAGNLTQIEHIVSRGRGWTRRQHFGGTGVAPVSHQLDWSRAGCAGESTFTVPHDANGRVTALPHLTRLDWDSFGCLRHVETRIVTAGQPDHAFYTYADNGARVRKVVEQGGRRAFERIYLSGFEIYREYNAGGTITLQRETMQVMDDSKTIALIETRTDTAASDRRIRYQLSNHMQSSHLEVDETGAIISYEEYTPYGNTSYIAGTNLIEVQRKQYRYNAKERDDETGFYYYGARYYAPWLGRWISPDPLGPANGLNPYMFNSGDPVGRIDSTGLEDHSHEVHEWKARGENKPISTIGSDAYYSGTLPAPDPMRPLTDTEKAVLGILGGTVMVVGGVLLAATLAGAPAGSVLAGTGVQIIGGTIAVTSISGGVVKGSLSSIEVAAADTPEEHAQFQRARHELDAVTSTSGRLVLLGVGLGTGDQELAMDAARTAGQMETVASSALGLPSLARSLPSAAPAASNLTRVNLAGPTTSVARGATLFGWAEACGFWAAKHATGKTVEQLSELSKIPIGATDVNQVIDILKAGGASARSIVLRNKSIATPARAEQLMKGFGPDTQFIVGYTVRRPVVPNFDHWVNATLKNGELVYTDVLNPAFQGLPADAIGIEVLVLHGAKPIRR